MNWLLRYRMFKIFVLLPLSHNAIFLNTPSHLLCNRLLHLRVSRGLAAWRTSAWDDDNNISSAM